MEYVIETEDKHKKTPVVNETMSNNQGSDDSEDDNIFVSKKKLSFFRSSRHNKFHLKSDDEESTSAPKTSFINGVQTDEESRDSVMATKPKVGKKKRVIKALNDDSSTEEESRTSDIEESTVKSSRIENKRNKMVEGFKNRFNNKKSFFIETADNLNKHEDTLNQSKKNNESRNSSVANSSDEEEFGNNSNLKKKMYEKSSISKTVVKNDININKPNYSDSHRSDVDEDNVSSTVSVQQWKLKDLCDDDDTESSDMSDRGSDQENWTQSHDPILKEQHSKPKEKRMSAKVAMENMQKIKSESNRMLREKEVSLPYHRPRQISLKDILKRRKPITGLDGKNLPIKMNDEQLKQYAQQLEERQKEIIELCKSESEEGSDGNDEVSMASDLEKVRENVTKTDNQLNVDRVMNDPQSNIHSTEFEKNVEICLRGEIETQVQNITDTEMGTMQIETQMQVEDVAVHHTNTSVDSQAMELTFYSKNTETYNIDSEELCYKKHNFKDNAKKIEIIDLLENNNCVESTGPSDKINHTETGNLEGKMDFTNKENCKDHTRKTSCIDEIADNFSDSDIDMSQIENIIEKIEEEGSKEISQAYDLKLKNVVPTLNPRLSGTPGSVIDLDFVSAEPTPPKKLTGIDLLKEKFVYFSQLKTPEEKEREKEKLIKPGHQHLKLKQELEEQMAEQRSLEWAKRIEEDKMRQQETEQINGKLSDCEDILEKDSCHEVEEASESDREESENEELDDHEQVEDKPKETNLLMDDEAEEDDDDDEERIVDNIIENEGSEGDDEGDSSDEENVSKEDDLARDETKQKRSRILKAFEDSDDDSGEENISKEHEKVQDVLDIHVKKPIEREDTDDIFSTQQSHSQNAYDCDELPLAQQNSLFTQVSQREDTAAERTNTASVEQLIIPITNTQQNTQTDLADIVGMCSGSFPSTQTQSVSPTAGTVPASLSQLMHSCDVAGSQDIGEDVLAMCTGRFAEGVISPTSTNTANEAQDGDGSVDDSTQSTQQKIKSLPNGSNLNASLRDLLDLQPDTEKGMSFFSSHLHDKPKNNEEKNADAENSQANGKLVIMSSDEEAVWTCSGKRRVLHKRIHRRKKQKFLQISDDEDTNIMPDSDSLVSSDENIDRLLDYDSEENEVQFNVDDMPPKMKKRNGTVFLDQEAELTSEDEWKGSGDEDEAGLDQLEREDGDNDHYNQKKLRSELEKIHMRQLLDQDKREVRLLQELLLEDGDLTGGHRQRKFRWKNNDSELEQQGTVPEDEHGDKQDEVESEEQWRKQRHEREVFLRQLMEQKREESLLNVSFNRTSIIKANLESKSMSSLLLEAKLPHSTSAETVAPEEKNILANVADKKISLKELPSPVKKPFLMQKQFRGSFLSRGQSSLDRLAALARPLSGEEERPGQVLSNNKRSFVFSAVSPPCPNAQLNEKTKMAKRKADAEMSTPVLIKKFRVNDKQVFSKKSLLDQIDS